MQNLTPFLSTTTEDTLSLVLETLSVVLEIDKGSWLSSEFATSLASAVLAVWPENNKGLPLRHVTREVLTGRDLNRPTISLHIS